MFTENMANPFCQYPDGIVTKADFLRRFFMQKIPSQKDRIRNYLDSGQTLTRLNAWSELGILECPARISELRSEGYPVSTTMITVLNRYGEAVRVAEWRKA